MNLFVLLYKDNIEHNCTQVMHITLLRTYFGRMFSISIYKNVQSRLRQICSLRKLLPPHCFFYYMGINGFYPVFM